MFLFLSPLSSLSSAHQHQHLLRVLLLYQQLFICFLILPIPAVFPSFLPLISAHFFIIPFIISLFCFYMCFPLLPSPLLLPPPWYNESNVLLLFREPQFDSRARETAAPNPPSYAVILLSGLVDEWEDVRESVMYKVC